MRWERLFAELEGQAGDFELQERDALVDELRDGDWAETSWRGLLGGRVVLEVLGLGRLEGQVVLANNAFVQVRGDRADHVVNSAAVLALVATERRADAASTVAAALGWGHVFRALRDAGDTVRVRRIDGSTVEGTVLVVGKDFVRLCDQSERERSLPFAAIAVVSGPT